jgi:hypothetical protein
MPNLRTRPPRLQPREIAEAVIQASELPDGTDERFAGYAIMGLPFASGHYLAFRHFPTTSIGEGYLTVWHRTPDRTWTIYADSPPHLSCARYLATGPVRTETTSIAVTWTGSHAMRVTAGDWLSWDLDLGSSPATRLMNQVGRLLPDAAWRNDTALTAIGYLAGPLLGVGRMRLHGNVPSGQRFQISPQVLWTVTASRAVIHGHDAGAPHPLPGQDRFGDLWLPQRGLFVATTARFESHDLSNHAPLPSFPAGPTAPTAAKER